VQKGLESEGVRVKIFEIPNIFSNDIISKIIVRSRNNIPVISVDKLKQADGILWGIPIRFGSMPVQVKAFLDETSQLWTSGALAGKFTGIFFSSANRHDLQETTAFAALANFYRHGMLYIPLGFADHSIFTASDVTGGSVYGAGTFENEDGSREPTTKEIEMAIHQGKTFAKIVYAYYRGTSWETDKSKDQLSEKDGKVTSRDAVQVGNKRNMIKNHKLSSGDRSTGAPPIVCMPMEMVGLEYTIL
jgi:NAD(P)H:quinone oxidoreductase type IV